MLWGLDGSVVSTRVSRHYADGARYGLQYLGALADVDTVLAKAGKGVAGLRELLYDAHLSSVWGVRESGVVKYGHRIEGTDARAVALCESHVMSWDVGRISREVLSAVSYGMAAFELLWHEKGGLWHIADVVCKPCEWFAWDVKSQAWKFRQTFTKIQSMPALRFMFERHNASYTNPYGEKLFSRIFWNATLKRNGLKWWSRWLEKFGSPYLIAKYGGADEAERARLLDALDVLQGSAVGVIGSEDELQTIESATKVASASAHREFVKFHNAEISKAILGQTMTTELDGQGSRAAAQVHDGVRVDIAHSDRRRVSSFFERVFALLVRVNLGEGVSVPRFVFDEPEDLQEPRIARDAQLFALAGMSASEEYLKQFGIGSQMLGQRSHAGGVFGESRNAEQLSQRGEDAEAKEDRKRESWLRGIVAGLFGRRAKRYQGHVDALVEARAQEIASAGSFEEALEVVMREERAASVEDVAGDVAELRAVARAVGGAYGAGRGHES